MRSPDELTTLFRTSGLKVTPQRQAVFDALYGDEGHPTADAVWARVREQMPTVSLRTVYQALNDLVELGEVQAVSVGTGAARFDPNISSHHHFVCRSCERIDDVTASAPRLTSSLRTDADTAIDGYAVDTAEIIFRGLCAACAADNRQPSG